LFYLLYFFTNVAGVRPALAGFILVVGKIWDAVNDPIMGYLTDKTRNAKWGRRYPWLVYGCVPFAIVYCFEWIVPPITNEWLLFTYYCFICILLNTSYTIITLPFGALAAELTLDYNERTQLGSFRIAFQILGTGLAIVVVIVLDYTISNERLKWAAVGAICGILCIICVMTAVFGTRKRYFYMFENGWIGERNAAVQQQMNLRQQLQVLVKNKPFLLMLGSFIFSNLAIDVTSSVLIYYARTSLDFTSETANLAILVVTLSALISVFGWSILSLRIGKKRTYYIGTSIWVVAQVVLIFLPKSNVYLLFIMSVFTGMGVGCTFLMPNVMIPDVIELDELETGQRREGLFYSFFVFSQKAATAFTLFIIGQLLEFTGYNGDSAQQPLSAQLTIRIIVGPLASFFLIIAIIFTYFYPITKEFHDDIKLQLQQRKLRNYIENSGDNTANEELLKPQTTNFPTDASQILYGISNMVSTTRK